MALTNHILTLVEPSIKLDEFKFNPLKDSTGETNVNKGLGEGTPLVIINNYLFDGDDIFSLEINVNDVLPKLSLTILDSQNKFLIDTFPRDGDVVNVRIAAPQDNVYRDIRIDFDIIDVQMPISSTVKIGNGAAKYTFNGVMKVPTLFADVCKYYEKDSSLNQLSKIATDLGLGFATNIDAANDAMNFIIAYGNMIDAIKNRVQHSYVREDSFQTFCIDPYYYLNFVDLNAIIESEEDVESVLTNLQEPFDGETKASVQGGSDADNMEIPLILSNHENYEGTGMHILRYALNNKSGRAMRANGYKRSVQYFENDSEEGILSFESEVITSSKLRDIEEPLKGRRDEERYKEEVKSKYVGRVDVDPITQNTHVNYNYALVHNQQNLDELKKMTLEIELSTFNPGLHRYQKLPVIIYNYSADQAAASNLIKRAKESENFDASQKADQENQLGDNASIDDFLTGYYVIGDIKYKYSAKIDGMTQTLTLLRREWPSRLNNIR